MSAMFAFGGAGDWPWVSKSLDALSEPCNLRAMLNNKGFLLWVTGLAGSGKTTLGRALKDRLQADGHLALVLDGDALREVVSHMFGYTSEERLRCAHFYSRLCRLLTEQGANVICCTISMFEEVRTANRENIPNYCEIYLKASPELLKLRNQKDLYGSDAQSVVGLNIEFQEPKAADLTFNMDDQHLNLATMVERVSREVKTRFSPGAT